MLCFNIRRINVHFDELLLFLENYVKSKQIYNTRLHGFVPLKNIWIKSIFLLFKKKLK